MFGIGGGELLFILIMILMLFGSDKIPDIARNLGRIMRQLKNATDELKSEIQSSAKESGIDKSSLTGGISDEIEKAKQQINNTLNLDNINPAEQITEPLEKTIEDFENLSGPIKRQR